MTFDHVLETEMHVSGDSDVLFECTAKGIEFYSNNIYTSTFNIMAV
jgi:hypothetical protein